MTIERLRNILQYRKQHLEDLNDDVKKFCTEMELKDLGGVRNLYEIVKMYLLKKNYFVIRFPLKDNEIGAFVYKGDSISYLVINTNVPIVNSNFAICHELYHIFSPAKEIESKFNIDLNYSENENEIRANLFAGNLLMPEAEFRQIFNKFNEINSSKKNLEEKKQLNVVISLMNYFNAPFMAVYIRCYELDLFNDSPEYLNIEQNIIDEEFKRLWIDNSILKASKIDDSENLIQYLITNGNEFVQNGYLNSRTLKIALENTKNLFSKLKAGK